MVKYSEFISLYSVMQTVGVYCNIVHGGLITAFKTQTLHCPCEAYFISMQNAMCMSHSGSQYGVRRRFWKTKKETLRGQLVNPQK